MQVRGYVGKRSEKSSLVAERGSSAVCRVPSVAEAEGNRLGKAAPSGALRAALPSLQKTSAATDGTRHTAGRGMAPSGSGMIPVKETKEKSSQ